MHEQTCTSKETKEKELNHFERQPPADVPTEFENIHERIPPAEGDDPLIIRSLD